MFVFQVFIRIFVLAEDFVQTLQRAAPSTYQQFSTFVAFAARFGRAHFSSSQLFVVNRRLSRTIKAYYYN